MRRLVEEVYNPTFNSEPDIPVQEVSKKDALETEFAKYEYIYQTLENTLEKLSNSSSEDCIVIDSIENQMARVNSYLESINDELDIIGDAGDENDYDDSYLSSSENKLDSLYQIVNSIRTSDDTAGYSVKINEADYVIISIDKINDIINMAKGQQVKFKNNRTRRESDSINVCNEISHDFEFVIDFDLNRNIGNYSREHDLEETIEDHADYFFNGNKSLEDAIGEIEYLYSAKDELINNYDINPIVFDDKYFNILKNKIIKLFKTRG
jgi:hypothetical protein